MKPPLGTKSVGTKAGEAEFAVLEERANGMMSFTWDAESRMHSVGGATYVYDADGNRVEKQGVGVTDTVYFGGRPVARLSAGQWTDLIYGPTGLLAEVPGQENASPVYRLLDHLGTEVGQSDASGRPLNPADYAPFGQTISGGTNDPYQFTGKERDQESGLDYFGARYYGSSMGRFMSPDDGSDQSPFSPQSWNLYSYGRNNPLSGTDPDGRQYTVCDANGNNCSHLDDPTFDNDEKKDQQHGEYFQNGSIFHLDADGNHVQDGTYHWDGPDAALTPEQFGKIGNDGMGAINWFGKQMVINAATDGLVGAAGAAIEASPLATQFGRNIAKGAAGETMANAILRMRGYKIIGKQVSVMTSAGRRVVDFVVEKDGELLAIEVKTGRGRDALQLAKDAAMESEGGRVGPSGGAALAGQTLKIRTIEMSPW